MNERHEEFDEVALEALFQEARADPPRTPQALMDRVVSDGLAAQPAQALGGPRQWLRALGGMAGLSGLVTATCVGFWIGVAPPDGMMDIPGLVFGGETLTETESGGFGWDVEEG